MIHAHVVQVKNTRTVVEEKHRTYQESVKEEEVGKQSLPLCNNYVYNCF